jgi:hypothetical protein
MNTYIFQTTDGLITCQLHPNHFGFLQNYTNDGNPIELFDITQNEADEGVKLYHKYLKFKQMVMDLIKGVHFPTQDELKNICDEIKPLSENQFIDWLQLMMTNNEKIMCQQIYLEPNLRTNYVITYYLKKLPVLTKVYHAISNGFVKVIKWYFSYMFKPSLSKYRDFCIHAAKCCCHRTLKWLLITYVEGVRNGQFKLDPPTQTISNDFLFNLAIACLNKSGTHRIFPSILLDQIKWLINDFIPSVSTEPLNVPGMTQNLFEACCFRGVLDVLQYLLTHETIASRYVANQRVLLCTIKHRFHLDTSELILELCKQRQVVLNKTGIFTDLIHHSKVECINWWLSKAAEYPFIVEGVPQTYTLMDALKGSLSSNKIIDKLKWMFDNQDKVGPIDLKNEYTHVFRKLYGRWRLHALEWLETLGDKRGLIKAFNYQSSSYCIVPPELTQFYESLSPERFENGCKFVRPAEPTEN